MVGQHVSEGQAQLRIAVQRRFGARCLYAIELQVAAVLIGRSGSGTGANDDVASLVGVGGKRGNECERED
jgi:hypothetical protein